MGSKARSSLFLTLFTILAVIGFIGPAAANATSYNIPGYKVIVLPDPEGLGGSPFNQAFGLNAKGQIAGSGGLAQYVYDLKTGEYTYYDDIRPLYIDNTGRMTGNCDIRDTDGNVTTIPAPPSLVAAGIPCGNPLATIRSISEKGIAAGFGLIQGDGVTDDQWLGFTYDTKTGVFTEFGHNPVRNITGGITNTGAVVGTGVIAGGTEDSDRAAYLRESDGTIKTFRAINADVPDPAFTNARGISENGKLIAGFYRSDFFGREKAFVIESKDLGPGNTDLVVNSIEIPVCNPDSLPPPGYITVAESIGYEVRNNGVLLMNCTDFYVNFDPFDVIRKPFVLVAIPDHLDESTLWED